MSRDLTPEEIDKEEIVISSDISKGNPLRNMLEYVLEN